MGQHVNWKTQEAKDRLIAALVRTLLDKKIKLDYHGVAANFGRGTTYHAIEGQFRSIKKQAAEIIVGHWNQVEGGSQASSPPKFEPVRRKKSANNGPRNGVKDGRVSKTPSPTKCKSKLPSGDFTDTTLNLETGGTSKVEPSRKEEASSPLIGVGDMVSETGSTIK
ncbi:hypothetical protein K402DRAFT_458146 [Aulographum hederae CBS 113979]|uniref:Uncharacterized protein n=1 Tax=Aulographum hederae CBS 113979 TaxID=1176131 RepID=A0A6G1GKL2_9PEZI|nr:hypothetical protein K402DRAFT_458146 [Aulographum hederae CBS 113979]